jgi:ABC-type branched-subunit amino acid transport system substrate-binding protein
VNSTIVTGAAALPSEGHADEGARKHPAFSEVSFIRTLTAGLDPAGNKLSVAMPTYRMPQPDMANLIAYLKRIETDSDPGVTETSIVVGTLLPDKTALTGLAQSMGDVLQAYFAEVNSRGGIYNRKIELRVMNGDATSTLANMKHLIEDQQVFAIVSGLTAGADTSVAALSQEKEVPFIGPSTLFRKGACRLTATFFICCLVLKNKRGRWSTLPRRKLIQQDRARP